MIYPFLYLFGPAAITYLLIHQVLEKDDVPWFNGLIELVCYASLDAVATVLILSLFRRAEIAKLQTGVNAIQYGRAAMILSIIVAVMTGIAISVIRKHVAFSIELELRGKDKPDENNKDH